jgi:hypothetical protein
MFLFEYESRESNSSIIRNLYAIDRWKIRKELDHYIYIMKFSSNRLIETTQVKMKLINEFNLDDSNRISLLMTYKKQQIHKSSNYSWIIVECLVCFCLNPEIEEDVCSLFKIGWI